MTVLRASGVLPQMPEGLKVRVDKGYEGTDAAHPELDVQQPIKKKPKQEQNILERAYNYTLSTKRIYVEHHFARLKKWESLTQVWRSTMAIHEDVFCVVAGLLNFRQSAQMELAG